MNISLEMALLVGSLLIFGSILISKTGYRFGIPTLLMFLLAGMLFGCDGLGIQFHDAEQAQYIGTIALCIILFSGGMDTRLADIRPVALPGIALSTVGVLATTALTGFFIYLISGWQHTEIGFSLMGSLLLAATMSSTDSASVFNILRTQRINLRHNLRPMLELESGSNDPMAYLLTIILIQCIQSGELSAGAIAGSLALQFAVGGLGGFLLGKASVWVVNRINLKNEELYPVLMISFAFIIYCSTFLLKGNGYLAVYIAGMVIGNSRLYHKKETGTFLNGVTWLLQVVMFLMLGLLVNPHEMLGVTVTAILVSLFMMLVARPVSVWFSLLPFGRKISTKSKLFVSWVGLRGAAPILFATYPVVNNVPGGEQIFNIVFFVTLISLVAQGMTLPWTARQLDLCDPVPEKPDFFGIEFPDTMDSSLHEMRCTKKMLAQGDHIRDIPFPKGVLVMLVKRDDKFLVPNGDLQLMPNDILLIVAQDGTQPPEIQT
ncbi:MAG TPA: potassium/proton antiporter [Candidatus Bacteroides avicola]|uniref:Potassium/proton antiporter n=1 Tax=Candidatus Bacteroides avicola TaxID=2838468 RepID=A0A9D2HUC0_9BACE|nr:potassium/proton antiporter [Bacteroidales bacterium SW292]HJA84786.1 potassium/proton antiporter [Candidatus Bacteroides avicola]